MDIPPIYKGKPTAYFDHNILDLFLKNNSLSFIEGIKNNYQVVYSFESLKEIKRSGDRAVDFLELLKSLDAMYLNVAVRQNLQLTGDAIIKLGNPYDDFEYYCKNIDPIIEKLGIASNTLLSKFYGGKSDSDFNDINFEQRKAFSEALNYIQDFADSELDSLSNEVVDLHGQEMSRAFEEAWYQSNNELRKHIDDSLECSGVFNYRDSIGIGPLQLNNIKPPNVIEKIWEAHRNLEGYKDKGFTIEQFLGTSLNPIYNREMHNYEKIISAYNVLNIVGFHPDSKMKKEERFTAAISDAGHAAIASFCDYVFSNDINFIKKAEAVYEFFELKTKFVSVKVINEK